MKYHMIAFLTGVILDWIIGDPVNFPHPVRWIGSLIDKLNTKLLIPYLNSGRNVKKEKTNGIWLVICVLAISVTASAVLLGLIYRINIVLGVTVEAVLTCYLLCAKSLYDESMAVFKALTDGDVERARHAVSMIVGRDTSVLDDKGIARAAVETVAENTSDGLIAPLLYIFIGGPVLGFAYKSINTMDSMVGYHSEKYENYGCFAAKLDDVANYIPARISALLMIAAAFLLGADYSGEDAVAIFKRDRYKHKSPNSAQTESVCAGALGIRLAGNAFYFGTLVAKPYIGDAKREIETEDIKRANKLMFATEILMVLLCVAMALPLL